MTAATASAAIEARFEDLEPLLAPGERTRLREMGERRREQALARAHAYVLIRSLLGLDPEEARVEYLPDGRPELRPGPGVDVSISHRRDRVLVGVMAAPRRVGVDTEWLDETLDADAFQAHALHERERFVVGRLRREGWPAKRAVIALWAIKEAVCKAAGLPMRPLSVVVAALDLGSGSVSLEPGCRHLVALAAGGWTIEEASIAVRGAHVDAVAVVRPA